MVAKNRWLQAQEYERKHWQRIADKIATGVMKQLDWYGWKARELEKKIAPYANIDKGNCKILEIGPGPIGIISFLKWGKERYAVEPLEDFFRNNATLVALRNPKVKYVKGCGESLPFEDKEFSLVIIDNVLDHTQEPEKVLREIYRVLMKNGLMFFTVNIRTNWGTFLHSILAKLNVDKGHPHSYSPKSIQNILKKHGFKILYEEHEDYNKIKKIYLKSKKIKNILKVYLDITEILYTAICSKE